MTFQNIQSPSLHQLQKCLDITAAAAASSGIRQLSDAASCDDEQTRRDLTQESFSRRAISNFRLGK